MDCNPPSSFVCGILQARIQEWVAISFSRVSPGLRVEPMSLASPELAGRFFTTEQPGMSKVRIITKTESSIMVIIVKVKVAQLCLTVCNPMDYTVHGIFHSRILEWVVSPFSRGSNIGLLHCRWILYQLSHKENPRILEWVVYPFSSISSLPGNPTMVSCTARGFFTKYST